MRWSRHQADTPLGELMEEQPDEAAPATAAGPVSDDDTAVRAPLADPGTVPLDDSTDPAEHETEPNDSFLDDEDYLPQERGGPGRLTTALVAALVLAVGVLGGVWVQKQLGTSAAAAGFAARQGAGPGTGTGGTGGTGTGTRGYGGTGAGTGAGAGTGGAAPGGAAAADAGAGGDTSGGTGGPGPGAAAAPAVVGTVTSAGKKSLVVTDLGGKKHTVTLSGTTTVTTTYTHGALKAGDTVAVAGSAGTDGSVTATGITVS